MPGFFCHPGLPLRRLLAAAGLVLGGTAYATEFPEGMDYLLRGSVSAQAHSNPFRLPDGHPALQGTNTALEKSLSGMLVVPLLSEQTRLDLSGTLADVRYDKDRVLNHRPAHLDAAFRWRAGDLLAGSLSYQYDDRLYRFLNRSWPDRETVSTQGIRGDVGLRVTESLTAPLVSFSRDRIRYETDEMRMLFNRDQTTWSVGARYAGKDLSFVHVGWREARSGYGDRTAEWASLIDDRYTDRELFIDWQWQFSPKTIIGGRMGALEREYANLAERTASIPYVRVRAGWDYSAKTRFDAEFWRQSWGNDDNPLILYSTVTGGRLSVRWTHSPKLRASFNIVRENQRDTLVGGGAGSEFEMLRLGPRIEWDATPNIMFTLDGWHDRTRGVGGSPSYQQNVVRIGVTFHTNNGKPGLLSQMWHWDCDTPKYVESWGVLSGLRA